jgi:hypothetical protein
LILHLPAPRSLISLRRDPPLRDIHNVGESSFGLSAAKETHKMLVSVSGYKLRFEQRVVPKRGKRPANVVNVMVQETDAWFGLFGGSDGEGHKASAQHDHSTTT